MLRSCRRRPGRRGLEIGEGFREDHDDRRLRLGDEIDPKDAAPGDILQFRDYVINVATTVVTITKRSGSTETRRETNTQTITRPHHTAIVESNDGDGKLTILEQNFMHVKKVKRNVMPWKGFTVGPTKKLTPIKGGGSTETTTTVATHGRGYAVGLSAEGEVMPSSMERPLAYPKVYLDIVEEHFQELDFLWELRERSLFRPGLFLKDLARIEDRARSHLNGLFVGELHAVDLCRPHLSGGDTAAATAAALAFLAFNITELDDEVLAAFAGGPPKAREGIRIALRQSDGARIGPRLTEIATSPDPGVRAASADLLAFHRLPPPKGLDALFFDDAPHVRVLTCGAIGRFGGPWGGDYLEHALKSANAEVRRAALEASARLGMPGIDRYCAARRRSAPTCHPTRRSSSSEFSAIPSISDSCRT